MKTDYITIILVALTLGVSKFIADLLTNILQHHLICRQHNNQMRAMMQPPPVEQIKAMLTPDVLRHMKKAMMEAEKEDWESESEKW